MSNECLRCKEVGEDRRTLWASCFYEMNELGIPFQQLKIEGKLFEQDGFIDGLFGPVPEWKKEPIAENWWAFYSLRVCKSCRADWLQAIKYWFENPPTEKDEDGIPVRKFGTTRFLKP